MDAKRLYHTVRLFMCMGSYARGKYIRDNHLFHETGERFSYQQRILPLYPNLIRVGNSVSIASNVTFLTHDGIHTMLSNDNLILRGYNLSTFQEGMGCIEIGDHVFIGAGSYIGYNVRIGNNVVVSAGSVITNDIPSNSVVRGNPAKLICTLDQFLKIKLARKGYPNDLDHRMGIYVGKELEKWLWDDFENQRRKSDNNG